MVGKDGYRTPEAWSYRSFRDFCCQIAATALDILRILGKNTHELIVLPVFRRGSSVGPVFRLDRIPGLLMACGSESLLTIRWQQVASMPSGFGLGREESVATFILGLGFACTGSLIGGDKTLNVCDEIGC